MDIRRRCSTIGCWGRYVVLRKKMLATDGRQLHNEKEKPHYLYYTGKTMRMNITVMDLARMGRREMRTGFW
jgi:hypothetical protein